MVKVEGPGNDRDFLVSEPFVYLYAMGKALAFDYGSQRTGLAITDELQIIGSPLDGINTADLWSYLAALLTKEKISDFVVGDPTLFGGDAHSATAIAQFCAELAKRYPAIPVHRVDESFSSRDAMQAMVAGGMSKAKRRDKKTLDRISAAVILQRWLSGRS